MAELFRLMTDRVELTWSSRRSAASRDLRNQVGSMGLFPRRAGVSVAGSWTPPGSAQEIPLTGGIGPLLHEETDYVLHTQSTGGRTVALRHRDSTLLGDIHNSKDRTSAYGNVNFRSQVGRSRFSVLVDDAPELDFELEVFPTKLDYATDYSAMLADVQDVMTGLALEYLTATTQLGGATRVVRSTDVEWLTLLRSLADKLESAIRYIAEHPVRRLSQDQVNVRLDQLRRADPRVRAAIARGKGTGQFRSLTNGTKIREILPATRTMPTLDTPEHRWLAAQLGVIRRHLVELAKVLDASAIESRAGKGSERTKQTRLEVETLLGRVSRLAGVEPLRAATGPPPPGFSSLQLVGAPGYREAFEAAVTLALGLRVGGGPLELSVKDVSTLYEYWCYLALMRLIRAELGAPSNLSELVHLEQGSLRVQLKKGWQTDARFKRGTRKVSLTYNPTFGDEAATLVAQKPDFVVAVEDEGWPRLLLVLDAKYRVQTDREYVDVYGAPGPPIDAINILHRYRDALLDKQLIGAAPSLKRTVVQGAALYPYVEDELGRFEHSRLWGSLERIGIGAIPMLPNHVEYAEAWLRNALSHGGWKLADAAIGHASSDRAHDWHAAAKETVMITNALQDGYRLRAVGDALELEMPLLDNSEQLNSQWVAVPDEQWLLVYEVDAVVVVSGPAAADTTVKYTLRRAPIKPVVESTQPLLDALPMWTSRLALERARSVIELDLRTEVEWRLLEELRALGLEVALIEGVSARHEPPWIVTPDRTRARYAGPSGFAIRKRDGTEFMVRGIEDVLDQLPATG